MKTLEAAVEAFSDTVDSLGGALKNKIAAPKGVYCRATLPFEEPVRPKDVLKPGVGLRADHAMIQVVPYVFRVICSNGAIWSRSGSAFSLETDASTTVREVEEFVHSSTAIAASKEAFQACLGEIESGIRAPVDSMLALLSMLREGNEAMQSLLLDVVLREMDRGAKVETRYDAMNLVTAAARDVRDPEVQWKMEAFATTLLTGSVSKKRLSSSRAAVLVS